VSKDNPYPVQLVLKDNLSEELPGEDDDEIIVNMGCNEGKLDIWIETPDGEASISLTKEQWLEIKAKGDELLP
jgi:hypothetical protein